MMTELEKEEDKLVDEIITKLRELARFKGKIERSLSEGSEGKFTEDLLGKISSDLAAIGALAKHIMSEGDEDKLDDCQNLAYEPHELDIMEMNWDKL